VNCQWEKTNILQFNSQWTTDDLTAEFTVDVNRCNG